MVVGGSNIHERLAHFFIDIYTIRLGDMELYEKYHQICIDRGGCAEDTEGKG